MGRVLSLAAVRGVGEQLRGALPMWAARLRTAGTAAFARAAASARAESSASTPRIHARSCAMSASSAIAQYAVRGADAA